MNKHNEAHTKTTIYLPKSLHVKAKQYALWTDTNLSQFMRIALRDKIKELEGTIKESRK